MLTGIAACFDCHFRSKQAEDDAVFISSPYSPVFSQEGGTGTFLTAKAV